MAFGWLAEFGGEAGFHQVLADPSCTDKSHYSGAAHVDFKSQQCVGRKIRHHLRQHAKADRRNPGGTGRGRPLHRLHVDVFDHLGIELAERLLRNGAREILEEVYQREIGQDAEISS